MHAAHAPSKGFEMKSEASETSRAVQSASSSMLAPVGILHSNRPKIKS